MRILILLSTLLLAPVVLAAEEQKIPALGTDEGPAAAPEPPELPEAVQSGEELEPEITLIQRENETIEEYRINGQLFKVKITPSSGPPYYLIDQDGDGVLETRANDSTTDSQVPQWILYSW
jgi:hypothetical protein